MTDIFEKIAEAMEAAFREKACVSWSEPYVDEGDGGIILDGCFDLRVVASVALQIVRADDLARRDSIARAIAREFSRQDGAPCEEPDDWDLTWAFIDQREPDFGLVADAVLSATTPAEVRTATKVCG